MKKSKQRNPNGKNIKPEEVIKSTKNTLWLIILTAATFLLVAILVHRYNQDNNVIVTAKQFYDRKSFNITCKSSDEIGKFKKFNGCTPVSVCGRGVKDNVVSQHEVNILKGIALRGFHYGQSNGGASIFDMHSGALSMGDKFINVYKYFETDELLKIFNESSLKVYKDVKEKILNAVSEEYGLDKNKLYLTSPTFFSHMTNKPPKTKHDEYWHVHIDKIQYGSFDYTTLLYLSNYGEDFTGGRFMFDGNKKDVIVEPRAGRVSFFTSGAENPHHVEKVLSGERYAITVSFTCDPEKAIDEPNIK